ncbi:MAG: hypothetical protein ABI785_04605 [Gemmatimonadales bacterium]
MSDTLLAVITTEAARSAATSKRPLFLVLAIGFVLGSRFLLYVLAPDRHTDFDLLYSAATQLLRGENPYRIATQWFPYPLPAALLAVPFTAIPLELARPIFDVLVGWAFVYALWRHRGPFALFAVLSGAYLFAMWNGQTTPLMVAASLVPALGFLLAVKPNTSAPLWVARPSQMAFWGMGAFVILSLWVLPSWPREWWAALQQDATQALPPILRPFGLILLFAVLRWRLPEGRLLLAIAFIPQNILPHELVSLAIIPASLFEMGMFVGGSWIAVAVAERMHLSHSIAEWTAASWPATLGAGYLPMLYLVLRRPSGRPLIGKERRRPYRLLDHELTVDVTPSADGGFTVQVTHIPTQLFAIESGPTRDVVRRKAHDKLAGILARTRRLAEKKEA